MVETLNPWYFKNGVLNLQGCKRIDNQVSMVITFFLIFLYFDF